MKRLDPIPSTLRFVLASVLLAPAPLLGQDGMLAGSWAGGFHQAEDYVFMQLHFKEDGGVSGTYDAPLLFQQGRPLKVTRNAAEVILEVPHQPGPRVFQGEIKAGTISGQMKERSTTAPFQFTRLAPIQSGEYLGTYESEPGHFAFVRSGPELGLDALQFIDFKNGRLSVLFPTSKTEFFTGPAVLVPHPVESRVKFAMGGDGRAKEFVWSGDGRSNWKRIERREEQVAFTNGSISLSGTLIFPSTPPPHPVIVYAAGGSSYGTREMFRVFAHFFALHGVAGLIYDKRGLGSSTGDWLRAGFDELTEDALAGVEMLRGRPEIDRRRIGMMGASQSGWIVALAAARSEQVAFIISQSGSGVGVEEQELFRGEAWLRADGFAEEEVQEAMKLFGSDMNVRAPARDGRHSRKWNGRPANGGGLPTPAGMQERIILFGIFGN